MIVIYTVIIGGYDKLHPTSWPGVCLTNSELKPVKGWKIRRIESLHEDPRRASRHPKMLAHTYFPGVEYTIYLDGNISLLRSPSRIIKDFLQEHDMALFPHPQRKCVYAEARKCIRLKKGDPKIIKTQMREYLKQGFPRNFGLTACWAIVRRNTSKVQRFCEAWWEEYLRFSCRDQLSFDYVRWQQDMKYKEIPGNLFKNQSSYFRRVEHQGSKS